MDDFSYDFVDFGASHESWHTSAGCLELWHERRVHGLGVTRRTWELREKGIKNWAPCGIFFLGGEALFREDLWPLEIWESVALSRVKKRGM